MCVREEEKRGINEYVRALNPQDLPKGLSVCLEKKDRPQLGEQERERWSAWERREQEQEKEEERAVIEVGRRSREEMDLPMWRRACNS